ncbi:phenylacetic acid degradation operon negative regulatory protein PaaX [Fervidibacillus halotolerans]|uniref:Phenylacetic acid degradation operon negative regulatory protein PaaX n=1 Tax=Fervidibacillus halotolerans TaxID=2980027 RepID=A0A9E8LZH2_9BACI|nr:phenylacetic acid degradation operon negative regulatory protein PaaX [Fervidibacillus halotolerans]WAA11846.1 phenylacetic acid degradation operon negative regulatory protein PaaX [Fervidibacillus halotolerans]
MMVTLNTRSMIFTLFGDYIRHYGGEIWIGSLIKLLKEFGHNEQSVRAAISRMHKQGWVYSRKEGNRSYYFLSPIGKERMEEAAERIFKLKPNIWDGKWRMLVYSIPEDKRHVRDEFRRELVWSGFGSLANGLWISPNDLTKQVYTLIDKYQIRPFVHYFVSSYKGPEENKTLVSTCWNLDEINQKYTNFIHQYEKKYEMDIASMNEGKKTDADCFVEKTKLVHEFRKFLFIDPGLPECLQPKQWYGKKAQTLFTNYYKLLAEPATRFFEKVIREGDDSIRRVRNFDVLHHPLMREQQ